ncbi:CASP-like protein 4D2 [Neltuma alba]|uniref:CASP-like protein 4D2 n=1 Tax=Neltuma alba TaxID=207710 RepID=UPI0010A42659|nr:CASP-like protein 4D2 [Prosopis alba]
MGSQAVAVSMLVLRIIALAASVATIVLLVTDNVKSDGFFIFQLKFQDIIAFRYALAVAAISAAYGILQLPFAVYYAVKEKRLIRNGCLPDFDFIADKVISLVLATAVGAGIGVSYEAKRGSLQNAGVPVLIIVDFNDKVDQFFERGIIASSVLAVACLCMAIVSVISSIDRSRSRGGFFN